MSATTSTQALSAPLPTARPARLPAGGWGVQLGRGEKGKAGDLVVVRTKGGKSWVAYLGEFRNESRWGQIWTSQRTDFDVPAETAPAPMRPQANKPQWYGTPFKVGDEWGVAIDRGETLVSGLAIDSNGFEVDWCEYGDVEPGEGDLVLVESRKGKKWLVRLVDGGLNRRRHRYEFTTKRA